MRLKTALAVGLLVCAAPSAAQAFCGFYVAGSDTELYNNATMVVMMRDGTKTVLSMQNNYEGPPENFAMVVPVPVVMSEDTVKTLDAAIFDRVDKLAAPRLVEYWEQDPCYVPEYYDDEMDSDMPMDSSADFDDDDDDGDDLGVKIEAEFTVGEYDIVILSAKHSTGLETWLGQNEYSIPEGSAPLLNPYVQSGMKFFVAKVDVKKVRFENGQAMLSPLRFHYDSTQFNLPVRLGLMNANGDQDLLVHILSPGQRYEVANYDNVTIPTNLNVSDDTRTSFAAFYAALFDRTLEKHPSAVVTEYAWDAGSCDPCPIPALSPEELMTLGGDVLKTDPYTSFVLTRLHARYNSEALGDDLVFRKADPIAGGREFQAADGSGIERGAIKDYSNNFQGRYIIRHAWTGPIECENPRRGIWGGPPGHGHGSPPQLQAAEDIAFAPRGDDISLDTYLAEDVEELDFKHTKGDGTKFKQTGIQSKPKSGCAGCSGTAGAGGAALALLVLGGLLVISRRRRID
jgi:MYXO-CTERM domain-containing protein